MVDCLTSPSTARPRLLQGFFVALRMTVAVVQNTTLLPEFCVEVFYAVRIKGAGLCADEGMPHCDCTWYGAPLSGANLA
jgi:hypothetical protein